VYAYLGVLIISFSFSPLKLNVLPQFEPDKVKMYGVGVSPSDGSIYATLPVAFTVDTTNAGTAELDVTVKVKVL
jgi:hypothetical protein